MSDGKRAFAAILQPVLEYYGANLTPAAIDVYWRHLQHVQPDDLQAMLDDHIRDTERGRWMPRVADLLAARLAESNPAIEHAWGLIAGLHFAHVQQDRAAAVALEAIGGEGRIRGSMERDLPALRKEFQAAYRRASSNGAAPMLASPNVPRLAG